MTLQKTLLSVFALAAAFVSCSSDKTDPEPTGSATVEKLMSPKNGLSVNTLLLNPDEFEGLLFDWESAGEELKYELAIDKADGDFSAPVAFFETTETSHMLLLDDILQLFEENKDSKGESAELAWRVYATSDLGRTQSKETRFFTLSTISKVVVETLIAPEKEIVFNLKKLLGDVTFSWSKAVWLGNEHEISYTLVIDEADKDFSNPLYSETFEASESALAATKTVITKAKLTELYNASSVAATEDSYDLKWAVYAKISTNNTISKEVRNFSIIPRTKMGEFNVGDDLYISVPNSTENGQLITFVSDNYYKTDNKSWHDRMEKIGQDWKDFPYYEVFTQLKKGEKYAFYTLNDDNEKGHFFKVNTTDGFVEMNDEDEALVEVAEDGIYRIRFKADDTKKIDVRKVEYVYLRFAWGGYDHNNCTDAVMNYAGKGRWSVAAYNIVLKDMGSFKEDRYRFVMKLAGIELLQGLSKNNEGSVTGDRPGQSENENYWHLQLSYTGWDFWVFKYPAWLADDSNLAKWCADVNLYMNAEKGHYTHEFVNPVEVKAFADGDPLYIDGTGSEAGQKLSYITADSYNTTIDKAGEVDAFKDQDYKYEIFTKLGAGSKFYFRSATSNAFYTLTADGTSVKKIASAAEAEGTTAKEGIYRIRFNITSGKAYIASVDKAEHFFCWTSVLTPLVYEGKGVWVAKNMNISLVKTAWGFDERYKFKLTIDGKAQPFGRISTNGDRPSASTAVDYWYIQPSREDQWNPAFKYPDALCDGNNLTRWYADLYLYMNDDKGHYTHEFKNAHE